MAADSLVSDGFDAGDTKYFLSRIKEGDLVWVKGSKDNVWELGKVIAAFEGDNDTIAVTTKSGKSVVTKRFFGGEEIPIVKKKTGYNDMTAMRFVNEPQILQNLESRSYNEQPYTFMGPVLVAVNPLKEILAMEKLKPGDPKILSKAHPFAIAELAYQQLLFAVRRPQEYVDSPTNQTVIVSGESGSGKTVSSKLVLQHLVARSGGGDLAAAIIGSNPVTESFGNSMTLRNPNSSRFGKMLRVYYDDNAKNIIGATVGTYLLERSRIIVHELGERNFHVFYEILSSGDTKLLSDLYLSKTGDYKALLPHTNKKEEKKAKFLKDDKKNFAITKKSLSLLGFEGDKLLELYSAVAAVLHLSNVEFEESEVSNTTASRVNDETRTSFNHAAELLGISPAEFEKIFTQLERKVGKQVITSPVSAAQATQLLEGVMRALYTRIFEYMIVSINKFVNKVTDHTLPHVGVLDIFGFETFQRNDLEQLLINYTNEALQLTFNKQVLEAEAALYEREKLAISEQDRAALDPSQVIDQSNKLCIDLLQGVALAAPSKKKKKSRVAGILDVIHEQGRIPGPSEQKMLQKLHKTFAKPLYPNYLVIKKKARSEFIIKHYAGKVPYTTGNFLLKNADTLPKSASELFLSASKVTTKDIWDAGKNLVISKKASIVSTFRQQIEKLNADLNSTQCSFIRCIKPNAEMHRDKGWFNRKYTTLQLRNLSVPKTADVLKAGLPTRIPYDQLVVRYKEIFGGKVKIPDVQNERGIKSFIAALFYAFEIPRSCYKLGLTKVFFKSGDLDKLEEVLSSADAWAKGNLDPTAEAERQRVIDRYKLYYVKRQWRVIFSAMYAGKVFTDLLEAQRKIKKLRLEAAILIQKMFRGMVARKKFGVLLYAKKLEDERIAREKAEAESKERERLAEIARQKEIEKQKQLKKFMEEKRKQQRKQKERFAKMFADFKKANQAAADFKEQELEMKRKERLKREEEDRIKKEEAEKKRKELEKLKQEREEQERQAAIAAEEERKAKLAYEEKLRKEKLEAEKAKKKEQIDSEAFIVKRDEEKMAEKEVMEKVVEELLDREDKKEARIYIEEEEDDKYDDENPWNIFDDLELDEVENMSHDSKDEERINQALKFLETLADGESDSEDESDAESDIDEEQHRKEIAREAHSGGSEANFKDYNGPFIVHVNLTKLNVNGAKRKRRFKTNLQPWKQSFAFIYPAHKKVLLHYGTNTTLKIQFNEKPDKFPAFIKNQQHYGKKLNVVYVTGARFLEDKTGEDVTRDMIISFQDNVKRSQFADLISQFLKTEEEMKRVEPVQKVEAPDIIKSSTRVSIKKRLPFNRRQERKEDLRKQTYMKFALLKRAVKGGKIKEENMADILLDAEEEDDEDDLA